VAEEPAVVTLTGADFNELNFFQLGGVLVSTGIVNRVCVPSKLLTR